jgi:hypothetical protein
MMQLGRVRFLLLVPEIDCFVFILFVVFCAVKMIAPWILILAHERNKDQTILSSTNWTSMTTKPNIRYDDRPDYRFYDISFI